MSLSMAGILIYRNVYLEIVVVGVVMVVILIFLMWLSRAKRYA